MAGGIGLTLTRASNELFIDQDWRPQITLQAEDRAHRIGQVNPLLIRIMVANHKIDRLLRSVIERKMKLFEGTVSLATTRPGERIKTDVERFDEIADLKIGTRTERKPVPVVPREPREEERRQEREPQHQESPVERERESQPQPLAGLPPILKRGYYTVVREDGSHRTYRLDTKPETATFAPGKTILSMLTGPENTSDYTGVAFAFSDRLQVWKRFLGKEMELQNDWKTIIGDPTMAGKQYALKSGNCYRCGKLLTDNISILAGLGPVCRSLDQ